MTDGEGDSETDEDVVDGSGSGSFLLGLREKKVLMDGRLAEVSTLATDSFRFRNMMMSNIDICLCKRRHGIAKREIALLYDINVHNYY